MALMLLNDLVLRRLVPSWWTGKLSDVTYLFFMPFALAALLALILPKLDERRIRAWAFGLTALAFTLGKLHPALNAAFGDLVQAAFGLPLRITADPTDLLALPVLAAAWWLWQRGTPPPLRLSLPQPARWLLLPLAAFLTLANAAPPSYGVTCLSAESGRVKALGYYDAWTSVDGGLTWQESSSDSYASICHDSGEEKVLIVPSSDVRYRYESGIIERSNDSGATWQLAYTPRPFTQAERAYHEKTTSADDNYADTPIDAVYDPGSGNVIFSMGHQGVLVRTAADGQWQWAAVGPYRHRALEQGGLQAYFILLQGELLLSLAAALLVFGALAQGSLPRKWYLLAMLFLGWLLFIFSAAVLPPALTNATYVNLISYFGLLAAVIWAFLNALLDAILLFRSARARLGRIALFALWALPAYIVPFLLWGVNLLPYYYLAAILSAILIGLVIVLGRSRNQTPAAKLDRST